MSLPAPHPPIGPPPDSAVSYDPGLPTNGHGNVLVFFEVYRDAEAFSEHLRGPFSEFREGNRDHFVTPWLGHPRPERRISIRTRSSFVPHWREARTSVV